jgi:hypothetical protein
MRHLTSQEVRDEMRGRDGAGSAPSRWVAASLRAQHPRLGPDSPDQALLAHAPDLNSTMLRAIEHDGARSLIMLSREWARGHDGFGVGVGLRFAPGHPPAFVCLSSDGDDITCRYGGPCLDDAIAAATGVAQQRVVGGYAPVDRGDALPWTRATFSAQMSRYEQLQHQITNDLAQRIIDHVHLHGLPRA